MNGKRITAIINYLIEKKYGIPSEQKNLFFLIGYILEVYLDSTQKAKGMAVAIVSISAVIEFDDSIELVIAPGLFPSASSVNFKFTSENEIDKVNFKSCNPVTLETEFADGGILKR